jgi:hypothetical protein
VTHASVVHRVDGDTLHVAGADSRLGRRCRGRTTRVVAGADHDRTRLRAGCRPGCRLAAEEFIGTGCAEGLVSGLANHHDGRHNDDGGEMNRTDEPGSAWPWWPWPQRAAWAVLLVVGGVGLFAAVIDLQGTGTAGIAADHASVFRSVAGQPWSAARVADPGSARYVSALEHAAALHETGFAVLLLLIIAIPLRRGERWAWWSAWATVAVQAGYLATFGWHGPVLLIRGAVLLAVTAVALVLLAPAVLRRAQPRPGARGAVRAPL